jgi:hypothetical protein
MTAGRVGDRLGHDASFGRMIWSSPESITTTRFGKVKNRFGEHPIVAIRPSPPSVVIDHVLRHPNPVRTRVPPAPELGRCQLCRLCQIPFVQRESGRLAELARLAAK